MARKEPQARVPAGLTDGFMRLARAGETEVVAIVNEAVADAVTSGGVDVAAVDGRLKARLVKLHSALVAEASASLTRAYAREVNAHYSYLRPSLDGKLVKPTPPTFAESLRAISLVTLNIYATAWQTINAAIAVSALLDEEAANG